MAFNKGYELKKFEAHWEKLRIEYAAAGMAEDAIQKMYDYDRQQFNSERTRIERTQEFTAPAYESTEEEASPLMLRYQEAITTTDTYHETKRSFAWIGEIEDENLLAALEQLSDSDLELITLYAYEEYDTVEISKLFGTTKQNISKKIRRIYFIRSDRMLFSVSGHSCSFTYLSAIHFSNTEDCSNGRVESYGARTGDLRGDGTDPGNDQVHPNPLCDLSAAFRRSQGFQNRSRAERRQEYGHLHRLPDPARSRLCCHAPLMPVLHSNHGR